MSNTPTWFIAVNTDTFNYYQSHSDSPSAPMTFDEITQFCGIPIVNGWYVMTLSPLENLATNYVQDYDGKIHGTPYSDFSACFRDDFTFGVIAGHATSSGMNYISAGILNGMAPSIAITGDVAAFLHEHGELSFIYNDDDAINFDFELHDGIFGGDLAFLNNFDYTFATEMYFEQIPGEPAFMQIHYNDSVDNYSATDSGEFSLTAHFISSESDHTPEEYAA